MEKRVQHHPLKRWRFEHGVTIATLARRLNVSQSYLSGIENRKKEPSLSVASDLVKATGGAVTLSDFVLEKGAKS